MQAAVKENKEEAERKEREKGGKAGKSGSLIGRRAFKWKGEERNERGVIECGY